MHAEFIIKVWTLAGFFIIILCVIISLLANYLENKKKEEERIQRIEKSNEEIRSAYIRDLTKIYPDISRYLASLSLELLTEIYEIMSCSRIEMISRLKKRSKNKFRAERYVRNGSGIPPIWRKK